MKNKVSPIKELRLRKAQLVDECAAHEERIVDSFNYIKSHPGSLLLGYVFSPSKEKSSLGIGGGDVAKISSIIKFSRQYIPTIWSFAQPMLIGVAVKNVRRLLFKKRK